MTGMRKLALARAAKTEVPAMRAAAMPSGSRAPAAPADPIVAAMNAAEAGVPRLLTPANVAEQLGLTERTLERWRITGEGPRFVKLSRSSVRYLAEDITAFIADRLRANTAQ